MEKVIVFEPNLATSTLPLIRCIIFLEGAICHGHVALQADSIKDRSSTRHPPTHMSKPKLEQVSRKKKREGSMSSFKSVRIVLEVVLFSAVSIRH